MAKIALSLLVFGLFGSFADSKHAGLRTPKIDTHSHVYPDFYKQAVIDAGWIPGPDGNAAPPGWNLTYHLQFMKDNNIEKSILSCSSPGTNLYPNNTANNIRLTQQFNNYTADLKRKHPDKFGIFASLPLPSIPDALIEIDRALDELNADGFVFLSNHFGLYGGDPKLAPVYEKLNARKAVIFVHPTAPCPKNTPPISGSGRLDYEAPLMDAYQAPILEFLFDSTRNLQDLIISGTAQTYGDVKWIIAHAGAALTPVFDRFLRTSSLLGPKIGSDRKAVAYDRANATALMQKQFWFDLAGFVVADQIWAMRRLFGADKFLYGSDFCFTNAAGAIELTGEMNKTFPEIYSDKDIAKMWQGNAVKLLGLR